MGPSVHQPVGLAQTFQIELAGPGHEMALDEARRLLYVSIPELDLIQVLSMTSFEVIDSISITTPRGLDLSEDGTTLYVALHGATSVGVIDLATNSVTETLVVPELGDSRTWDVIEAQPGRLFVSAHPSSSGFAWIVQIDRNNGDAMQRVASNRIIRCAPVFEASPDQASLYIGACFSPNSLYKLDLNDPTAPIILEDDHGSVGGTDHLELNPAGTRIVLRSGQVLRTADFIQVGAIAGGPTAISASGDVAYNVQPDGMVELFDMQTFLPAGRLSLPCGEGGFFNSFRDVRLLPGDSGLVALHAGEICGVTFEALASMHLSPGPTVFLSTQSFDVAARVDTTGLRITQLRAFLDGTDISTHVNQAALRGRTSSGLTTFRLPGFKPGDPGDHALRFDITLADGTLLTSLTTWETLATQEGSRFASTR